MMNEENSAKAKTTELSKFPDWLDKNLIKHFVIPALGIMMVFTVFWYFKEQIYIVFDIDTYLSWHNILEFSSVVVSIIIFLISWYSYKQTGNQRDIFLGTAFLVVGVVDFMHTLSFPGMPAFISQNTTNKAIDYWIVARLIQAAALAGSGFISTRQQFHRFIRAKLLMGALFLIIATFYVITYLPHLIPEMFVPGEGLTPTKIWLEYSVVFIIFLAIGKYFLIYRQTRTSMVRTLLLGLMFFVFSELSFTLYASAFDIYNLLGHVFKTGTMILIFQGLFVSSVQEPFIKLKLAEDIARIERDNLKNIFEAIEDGVYIVNQEYDIQYVNPVLVKDFGPFEGRKCYAYFHDREEVCPWCKTPDVLEGKTVRWEWQSLKNQKTYDLIDTPLMNTDGSISKLEIFRDITERVRAEQKLVNSENLLNATQRIAGVGGWMWNVENETMFWTDETYRIHEIDPSEIKAGSNEHIERGATCYDEKDRPIILEAFQKCVDEGMPYDLVFPFTTVKGNRIWIRTAAQAEKENGKVVYVLGNIINITERVQIEENIIKEKEFSEKIIDTSKAIIIGLDKNHKIQLFNKGAEKITGYKRTNVLEKDWFKVFFPDGILDDMEKVWKDSWGQKIHSNINPILTKNGAERIVSWQTTGIYEGDDEKNHMLISIGEDITERVQTEELLKESERKLQKILTTVPLGIGLIVDRKLGWSNERMHELLGYPDGGLIGKSAKSIYENENEYSRAGKIAYEMMSEKGVGEVETQWKRKDNRIFDCLIRIAPLNISNPAEGNIAVISDITERKRAEEELQKYQQQLELLVEERTAELKKANKELETFSYSVSHDLRAPLRAIDGFTNILMEDYVSKLDDEGKRLGSVLQQSARKMGQLIDDLLAFSRLGRSAMSFSDIEMKKMAKTIYQEETNPKARKRITFTLADLPNVEGDPAMMRQMWRNLISNALKFSEHHKQAVISISCQEEEDQVTYCIKDNGAGFNMKYKDKLFTVFQRLHSEKEFEGTGVGLALVQQIIRRHGGEVWAEGEVDRGAAFYFSLPKKRKA